MIENERDVYKRQFLTACRRKSEKHMKMRIAKFKGKKVPVPGKNCSGEELDPAAACLKKTAYFAKKVIYKKIGIAF